MKTCECETMALVSSTVGLSIAWNGSCSPLCLCLRTVSIFSGCNFYRFPCTEVILSAVVISGSCRITVAQILIKQANNRELHESITCSHGCWQVSFLFVSTVAMETLQTFLTKNPIIFSCAIGLVAFTVCDDSCLSIWIAVVFSHVQGQSQLQR